MPDIGNAISCGFPKLTIGDSTLDCGGWHWQEGWQGLVPSQSNLDHAIAALGAPCYIGELANGASYDFCGGSVRIVILDGESTINYLSIRPEFLPLQMVPHFLEEALALYGKFVVTRVERLEGAVYERPGMRIHADAACDRPRIRHLEIFLPGD